MITIENWRNGTHGCQFWMSVEGVAYQVEGLGLRNTWVSGKIVEVHSCPTCGGGEQYYEGQTFAEYVVADPDGSLRF